MVRINYYKGEFINKAQIKLFSIILLLLIYTNQSFANNINKKLTLQLSWFNQFQFAGYYIAKEKGFYKEAGLDVNINPFEFGLDIPKDISEGKYDFAIGRETLILEKTNGKKIVALYALFQSSPLVLLSKKESGINTISNFIDKKIMTTIDDANEISIKAMILSQNLELKNLNFIKHTHNINDLVTNKTDIISAYSSKTPFHLQRMGVDYNVFLPTKYGFDMYSDLLYTNESNINNNLDNVLKFKAASLKGWEYAYTHIDETVNLILSTYNTQNLSKDELLFEAEELKKLSYFKTNDIGNINIDKMQRIYDLYNIMGLVKKNINITDFVFIENNIFVYLKSVWNNLSTYSEFPYIYFFLSLFLFLILLIIYKQINLHILTNKLFEKEKELLLKNKVLKSVSEKDPLTNLYNRRYFESISKEYIALSQRQSNDICILMIDIDKFKNVNDTYGHQVGDNVLSEFSTIMMQSKRESDVVARYGGEEFIILLPDTSLSGAKIYSEKLRKKIEKHNLIIDSLTLNITVSMGLTLLKFNDKIENALKRADEGLYNSKNNGRNQLSIIY